MAFSTCRNLVDKYHPGWTGTTKIFLSHSGASNFSFFPDGDFWPSSVGILQESDGMQNMAISISKQCLGLGACPMMVNRGGGG